MEVKATAVEGASAYVPYVLTIQVDTPAEAEVVEKLGQLNCTIPDALRNTGHLNAEQHPLFKAMQTGVSAAHSALKAELAKATSGGKTQARRKKA